MIILNITIALIGLISIFLTRKINLEHIDLGFKRHFIILAFKMAFYFFTVFTFLMFMDKVYWPIAIISSLINIILFHFTEAYFSYRNLLIKRNPNV